MAAHWERIDYKLVGYNRMINTILFEPWQRPIFNHTYGANHKNNERRNDD